jgi:2,3-diketo-5-methylthio-1-phosphopentane phosphatase
MAADYTVFFDFDNTITTFDILDDMVSRFSRDDAWVTLEERWRRGEIGSRECLEGQIRGVRLTKRALDRYLATVKIDPFFKRLLKLCRSRKMNTYVLSDDFDYIIKKVLKNNGLSGLDVSCNLLKVSGDRLIPRYPFTNRRCPRCAHCKKKNLIAKTSSGSRVVYIGDGLSDLCPSKKADIIFAKGSLERRLKADKKHFIPFKGLNEVYDYFKRRMP